MFASSVSVGSEPIDLPFELWTQVG